VSRPGWAAPGGHFLRHMYIMIYISFDNTNITESFINEIMDLQKNHVVMRLRHVAAEMEHGLRKMMKRRTTDKPLEELDKERNRFNLYQLCTLKKSERDLSLADAVEKLTT
jgi:hypothetical protein